MKPGNLGQGYIQVYTGNGKGKTTAALGLAVRAAGHGLHTVIVQFMKGWIDYGELQGARMLAPYVEIHQAGRDTFVNRKNPDPEDIRLALDGWRLAKGILLDGKADILVLDEINCAMDFGLIPCEEVVEVLRNKPAGMEVVLTGRGAPAAVIEIADLVTEMKEVKHYYAKGVDARVGVER
ncbi:MAG: cob(I)yrinic acid a,c-diamide adenosyltransferase [Deltaproteobacteria bacterium RBG_19FT_COMBO_60_16]|nr:MAG: cob(I)yrinic acid a,c-diamide adenosyltransferase [Deltaproteobacteria bacterium RBG_16_64_85]OGP99888.1 MAG: cob(I)yrinic acid a,c-diamide adenosyltransferase [Deltaproteobacteria bacterium RBG_19FT_COMBO_60_16]